MIRLFRVAPPTVHQMVLSPHKAGLISRKPGVPRSIAVLLERSGALKHCTVAGRYRRAMAALVVTAGPLSADNQPPAVR